MTRNRDGDAFVVDSLGTHLRASLSLSSLSSHEKDLDLDSTKHKEMTFFVVLCCCCGQLHKALSLFGASKALH